MGLGFLFVFCSFNILSGLGGFCMRMYLYADTNIHTVLHAVNMVPFERQGHLLTALDHKT